MRSGVLRWLAVVVLAPMLALSTFGCAAFLVHGHDDHGTHLHPVSPLKVSKLAAAEHDNHHGHSHSLSSADRACVPDEESGGVEPDAVPAGVIVSIDSHRQLTTRVTVLGNVLLPPATFTITVFVMPTSPDPDRQAGSPGGLVFGGPLDLAALSASDRLLRTSRALLI